MFVFVHPLMCEHVHTSVHTNTSTCVRSGVRSRFRPQDNTPSWPPKRLTAPDRRRPSEGFAALAAAVRLSAFILPEIQNITAKDDMELDKMGERKQAVFAIIPDNDSTFNYIVGMLYTCAFQSLYYQADKVHQGALPVPVRMMMDEFCNVSLPDDFGKLQATMRSRNIMSTIVLQNISALKALFKDDWEGLIGNADTLLYLGGNEVSTFKYISELLGKETLDTRTRSVSKGRNGSGSVNYQQTGRELPYLFVKSSVALNLS